MKPTRVQRFVGVGLVLGSPFQWSNTVAAKPSVQAQSERVIAPLAETSSEGAVSKRKSASLRVPADAASKSVATTRRVLRRDRHFPLWLELTGVGLGVAGVVSGAILLAFDGRRSEPGGLRYDNFAHGFGILAGGSQVLVFSAVFLTIDQWPKNRRPRSEPKGLALRF